MKILKVIDTEKYYGANMIPVSEPNITEKELEYVTDCAPKYRNTIIHLVTGILDLPTQC